MSNWRIKEIFSPKYNKTLYIPQQKGWFFYSSFTYQEYCEYIEKRHNMTGEFELVWECVDNRVGFKTVEGAKRMIEYYREYWRILAEHDEAEKEARKKGKNIKPKYIEVD